jgi:hypothetical protein
MANAVRYPTFAFLIERQKYRAIDILRPVRDLRRVGTYLAKERW